MPNWVMHRGVFEGPKAQIDELEKLVKSDDRDLFFNQLPEWVRDSIRNLK